MIFMKKFYFLSRGKQLCGILKERKNAPLIVIVHGWTSSKKGKTMKTLKFLAKTKYAVLAFDFYGHGESEGRLEDMTISIGVRNVIDAVKYARKLGYKNIILIGSSFGGLCSMLAAPEIKPAAIVLRAPISYYFEETLDNKGKKFRKEYKKFSSYNAAKKIKCPVLIFHGKKDTRVPIEQSRKLSKLLDNCELMELKDSDHDFTENESKRMFKETEKFLKQTIK